jgi:hypothetical protein
LPTRDFALFGEHTELDVHLDRLVGGTGLRRYAGQCPLGVPKEGLDNVLLRDDGADIKASIALRMARRNSRADDRIVELRATWRGKSGEFCGGF